VMLLERVQAVPGVVSTSGSLFATVSAAFLCRFPPPADHQQDLVAAVLKGARCALRGPFATLTWVIMQNPELGDIFLFEILEVMDWCCIKCEGATILQKLVARAHHAPHRRVKGEILDQEQLTEAALQPMCPVLRAMPQ